MTYVEGIPLRYLVRLVCKSCLANISGAILEKKLSLELCDGCKQKCVDYKRIKEAAAKACEGIGDLE